MRIAQISTVGTPVREHQSGSIEFLVWLLGRELTRLGHEVTTFAAAGSETCGELVATLPGTYGMGGSPHDWQLCEWINLCRALEQSGRFDVVHSHAYLWGLPLDRLARAPMVHTFHVTPYEEEARLWALAIKERDERRGMRDEHRQGLIPSPTPHPSFLIPHPFPPPHVTAISHYQWSGYPQFRPCAVIHHGIDPAQFPFQAEPEDYVCFLGRFMGGKGPLQAVKTAQGLGLRLRLAGPRNDYFRKHIEPLVDGKMVQHLGFVSGVEKSKLLGGARALLYPVQSPEPFGLVLIEAMMCGTPVAAIRLGAVPEIVDEGITGYCAGSMEDFAATVTQAMSLDRRKVRERAEERFSSARMAAEYVQVYQRLAGRS
jgi:glycosyltransferase involved in cell wall biosynthesis